MGEQVTASPVKGGRVKRRMRYWVYGGIAFGCVYIRTYDRLEAEVQV